MEILPDEVLLSIFSYIGYRTILGRVCSRWRCLAGDPHLKNRWNNDAYQAAYEGYTL